MSYFMNKFLYTLGCMVVLKYIYNFLLWIIFYIRSLTTERKLSEYGKTAIITGCTSGIGRGITYRILKENVNLLLVSRNEQELIKLKQDLLDKNPDYKGVIDYCVFNFSTSDFETYKIIEEKIKNLDIGILINNVGISYDHPMYYQELSPSMISDLVNINLLSSYFMTKLVLPYMQKQKRGLIIFVSTGASILDSCPLLTVYASVKNAINSFAKSLSVELRNDGIHVQCQAPLFVTTKLSKIKKASLTVPNPDTYAIEAVRKMKEASFFSSSPICSPFPMHNIQLFICNLIPRCIFEPIILFTHNKIRNIAKKKSKKSQ